MIMSSASSTEWILVNLIFNESNHGKELVYDGNDTIHVDVSFTKLTLTDSIGYLYHITVLEDLIDSIPHFRKTINLTILIKSDIDFLFECGFLKNVAKRLHEELKKYCLSKFKKSFSFEK